VGRVVEPGSWVSFGCGWVGGLVVFKTVLVRDARIWALVGPLVSLCLAGCCWLLCFGRGSPGPYVFGVVVADGRVGGAFGSMFSAVVFSCALVAVSSHGRCSCVASK